MTSGTADSFDTIKRFIFNEMDIRGEIAQTDRAFRDLISDHSYPRNIRKLLGEMQIAITLMTETVKFRGSIMLQLRGNGPLVYAYINSNENQETLIPEDGARYQGIIDLTHDNLCECIEDYYRQSVQIETRVWIYCDPDKEKAAGILIQKLPTENEEKLRNDFAHIATLTDSMTEGEILSLDSNDVLYRLFHQESVNTFHPKHICFRCVCSKEHFRESLVSMAPEELEKILEEQGKVSVNCHCCGKTFVYTPDEVRELIAQARDKNRQVTS